MNLWQVLYTKMPQISSMKQVDEIGGHFYEK
jgi:hypothetical protein